jgi:hypothetical protein
MHPEKHQIVGIHINDRVKKAHQVQDTLTKFGCLIKTRLGIHETGEEYCSPNGLIILELAGDTAQGEQMLADLSAIEGVDVQKMIFYHP